MGLVLAMTDKEKIIISCPCGHEVTITVKDSRRADKMHFDAPKAVKIKRKKKRLIEEGKESCIQQKRR